jgi:TFIIF-interacting CTD phosphatase-like protein
MEKINILLDLDNTLISSLSKKEEKHIYKPRMKKFRWENMENVYKVFERPGLQPFLDFLFKHFNVSIWTAASKTYALFIIDKFILDNHPERTLDYIFFSHHCKRSNKIKKTQKSIEILKNNFKLHNYNRYNTYIIDDHPEVFKSQPDNCIQIKPFEFVNRQSYNDTELQTTIKPQLEAMLQK